MSWLPNSLNGNGLQMARNVKMSDEQKTEFINTTVDYYKQLFKGRKEITAVDEGGGVHTMNKTHFINKLKDVENYNFTNKKISIYFGEIFTLDDGRLQHCIFMVKDGCWHRYYNSNVPIK